MSALLALHGFTGSPRSWDFLPEVPNVTRCFIPSLVGHFASEAGPEVTDFELEVDRLTRLSAEANALHVVGYSLGARLALGIALRHPMRVSRLTLISGHPGLSSDAERAERRTSDERWCELLLSRGMLAFVDAWQAQPLWTTQARLDPGILERKRSERLSHDATGLIRSLRVTGLAQMPNYRGALAQIRVPVTLIAGGLDAKFVTLAQQMAKLVPHADLHIVEEAGHDLLLERPEFVTEVIRRGHQP
ncbi:MAG TPA: alpha/beta fold hydrolase [Polyangiaceae bacterium]|nr:alpha/beta fold hydrolase [Polyangiaceae bacterium]